jgi:hypothetical protein
METENTSNNTEKFNCLKCDFKCSKKGDWARHLLTTKHKNMYNVTTSDEEIHNNTSYYKCMNCSKNYISRNGLWLHKKKCTTIEESSNYITDSSITDSSNNIIELLINENKDFKNMIMELVKTNNDLQKQMVDVCLKIQPNNTNINSNNNTTNNKTFNLQLFLNEECKDALNMSEFINSIELKISDLENIGKLGYVEGMSNIIIRELNDTDMYKRPVHCSDAKRETVYVKEENKWERENSESKQMVKAVRVIDKKNYQLLTSWKNMDPKCVDSKSNQCDKYMKIMSKVMDGDIENVNKVIKKIAKEVVIDKS